MKKMTVLYGIALAIAFTLATPVLLTALQLFFRYEALRVFVVLGTVMYCAALLPRSERRSGRIFTMLAVCFAAVFLLMSRSSFGLLVLGSVAIVWGVRALLLGRSVLQITADGVLAAVALFIAIFAGSATLSISFAVWTFLLVLSAGPLLTAYTVPKRAVEHPPLPASASRFERAFQSAEHAIAALSRAR